MIRRQQSLRARKRNHHTRFKCDGKQGIWFRCKFNMPRVGHFWAGKQVVIL